MFRWGVLVMSEELRELVEKLSRLESEQEVLKLKLQELESEQSRDHELITSIQRQLSTMYREIEDVKKVLTTKIEDSNKLILEQNRLMMDTTTKQSVNFFKLIALLIAALLLLIGVKGISVLPFF